MKKLNTELEQFIYNIWDFNSESGEWPEYYNGVSEMIQIRDASIRAEALKEAAERAIEYVRALSYESREIWSTYEDVGLRQAILGETKGE